VLYTGTFSKSFFPAYVWPTGGAPSLQSTFHEALTAGQGRDRFCRKRWWQRLCKRAFCPPFAQNASVVRHQARLSCEALERVFGSSLHIQPQAGGIQVLAYLNEHQSDKALATAAQAAGLGVKALSEWDAGTPPQNGLLMGFTNFTRAEEAQAAVKRLSALLSP
jgi:GntR family transcriptional regulator/MocR family aminotransferase